MNLLTTAVAVLLISLAMCNSQALANCDTSSLSANDLTWSAGTVNSHQDAIISTEIPGVITWIVEPGQELKKGDVILRLEDTQYRIAVKESQTKLKLLEMKIDYLEKKYQASSSLLGSASISEMYVDDLKFDLDSARADQQLEKLALQKNNSLLEKASLRSPFAGVIAERIASVGQFLAIADPILRIVDTKNVYIETYLPHAMAQTVDNETVVLVETDAGIICASVDRILPVSTTATNVAVWLALPESNAIVGSNVRVSFISD